MVTVITPAGNPAAGPVHAPAPTPLPPRLIGADPARIELYRRREALATSHAGRDLQRALTLARLLARQLRHVGDLYSEGEAGRVLAAAGLDPNPPEGVSWTAEQFDDAIADCAGVLWTLDQFASALANNLPPVSRDRKDGAA